MHHSAHVDDVGAGGDENDYDDYGSDDGDCAVCAYDDDMAMAKTTQTLFIVKMNNEIMVFRRQSIKFISIFKHLPELLFQ